MEVPSLPQLHLYTSFLESWGVKHRFSSADYPQSNGRAELGVKASKQIIIDSTAHNGSLNNASGAKSIMQYPPLPHTKLSPAQILLHRQLCDHFPTNPKHCKLHTDWIISAEQCEHALA